MNKNSSVNNEASLLPSKHRWITSTNSEIHQFVYTLVYHLALKFGHSCQEVEAANMLVAVVSGLPLRAHPALRASSLTWSQHLASFDRTHH